MTSLVICGIRGRMGRAVAGLAAARDDVRIVAGTGRAEDGTGGERVLPLERAGDAIRECDVVIDFTSAAGTAGLLKHHAAALAGRALVVGTTGLEEATAVALDALAVHAAVLSAANFSIGVNLLLAVAERVAAALPAEEYDVEIVEAHHRGKVDAPSGTALALARAVAQGRGVRLEDVRRDGRSGDTGVRPHGEVGMHAVRGGGVIGAHRVLFLGGRERIELVHEAADRALFAEGALRAALWLAGRAPGRYDMRQVLGFGGEGG